MSDYVIRATGGNGQIRAFVCDTTKLVEKARSLHNTTKVATAAFGRTLTATSMMGLMMKNPEDKLTVVIKGGGPIGSILVTSDSKGMVKGYIKNPNVEVEDYPDGKLNVAKAVGNNGVIKVIKDFGLKQPYNGAYPIKSGEIAEDFTNYFAMSEQTPSVVSLGVLTSKNKVECAGGFIVQLMPDTSEEIINKLENNISNINSMTNMLKSDLKPEEILDIVLKDLNPKIMDKCFVEFKCDCSRKRMADALISLGKEKLQEIIKEDKGAEIGCQFCGVKHYFNEGELNELLESI